MKNKNYSGFRMNSCGTPKKEKRPDMHLLRKILQELLESSNVIHVMSERGIMLEEAILNKSVVGSRNEKPKVWARN